MPSPSTSRKVLLYGLDYTLLDTRRLILEHAGLWVETAHGPEELDRLQANFQYDLLVLCHTVPKDQRLAVSSTVKHPLAILEIAVLLAPDRFLDNVQKLLA